MPKKPSQTQHQNTVMKLALIKLWNPLPSSMSDVPQLKTTETWKKISEVTAVGNGLEDGHGD